MPIDFHLFALRLRKISFALRHSFARRILIQHHVLAASEHKNVICIGFDLIVDVGANRGQFAVAARCLLPDAKIHSFEPLPLPFKVLVDGFGRDCAFEPHAFAAGEAPGVSTINVSGRDDSSSLLPISSLQNALYPGTGSVGVEEISVCRLDQVLSCAEIPAKSLLKIDTQGFELSVLKGAEILLERFGYIYCECSFLELYQGQALACDVVDFLRVHGFDLVGVYSASYDNNGICIQADLLFKGKRQDGGVADPRASE